MLRTFGCGRKATFPQESQLGRTMLGKCSWTPFCQRHVPRNLVFLIDSVVALRVACILNEMLTAGCDTLQTTLVRL